MESSNSASAPSSKFSITKAGMIAGAMVLLLVALLTWKSWFAAESPSKPEEAPQQETPQQGAQQQGPQQHEK